MSLAPQTRFGPYEILEPIGAGGMGEVYRARDTKLGRDVAIKVLPAAFAGDADRMTRFQREAQVLAALNHPGIATIHGLEESGSVRALVMELVPGPTLADRIAQGALPVEEALAIARQIAEAVEYAHERGIIHRDLKPANVKLTADGAVKVLDFGLAKALSDDPVAPDVSQSPTLSVAGTRDGMILGTAAYMAPEQIKGKPATRRSDIWSFGVVLFEMLSGKRLFSGDTAAETLAAVLTSKPEWGALPSAIPPRVRKLLGRCLEQDPRRRLQAIGEARIAIEDVLTGASDPPLQGQARSQPVLPWLVAATAVAALGLGLWGPWRAPPRGKTPLRLSIDLGTNASLVRGGISSSIALSRDGSTLAFVGAKAGGPSQLYVRRLEQSTAAALSGTENARDPFFSPDGQWIGFFADGKLKKIGVSGGPSITLCESQDFRGGTWAEDGTIFFQPSGGPSTALLSVSSAGGTPQVFAKTDTVAGAGRWPQALPGGLGVFSTVIPAGSNVTGFNGASLALQSSAGAARKLVHSGGYHWRYVETGHLVFMNRGSLFAVPFDLGRMAVTGPAVPAVEGVASNGISAGAHFSLSGEGTLAYLPGPSSGGASSIAWLDRQGKTEVLQIMATDAFNLRFSPDGRRLAMDIGDGGQRDVWVYELERDTLARLTFDPENDQAPVWTPDGRRIAFASTRGNKIRNMYWQRSDNTGEAQRLTESKNLQTPYAWHPNGKTFVFGEVTPETESDLMMLTVEGDEATGFKPGKPEVLLKTPSNESGAAFSPDGRWLAYTSNVSGRFEVYVRPFPGPGGQWQVSTGGGSAPVWSRAGSEIVYRAGDTKLMFAPYTVDKDSFRHEKPRVWSEVPIQGRGGSRVFDLHPDGRRVAMLLPLTPEGDNKIDRLTLIFNFGDELRRIAPPGKR